MLRPLIGMCERGTQRQLSAFGSSRHNPGYAKSPGVRARSTTKLMVVSKGQTMLVNKRTLAGATAALIAATAFGGSSTMVNAADAPAPTMHMRFIAHSDRNINFGRRTFGGTEIDRRAGHRVGFDLISGKFDPATGTATIDVAVARRGGLLYGKVHTVSATRYVGRVTGGSGRFKGASGTVTARNLNQQGSRTRVVVTYTLP
jgi:hypothetical protein